MRNRAGTVAIIGLMLAFVVVIGFVERQIPLSLTVPGIRLGLSNAVVLAALYLFRFRTALGLCIMKCLMLAALASGFAALPYSLSGSLLSFFAMCALVRFADGLVSPIGVSVCGALCHVFGQYLAAALIVEDMGLLAALPLPMAIAAVSGVPVGILVKCALPVARRFGV